MSAQSYDADGILREQWDDATRTYTAYDETGAVVESRPYTEQENQAADAALLAEQARVEQEAFTQAQHDLTRATLALAEAAYTPGLEWVQPTGSQDAYPLDAMVTHNAKTWMSLAAFNVWEPGVSGWREQVTEGYPEWIQPTGAHDAYNLGDRVTFEGGDYESLMNANVWSPIENPAAWLAL